MGHREVGSHHLAGLRDLCEGCLGLPQDSPPPAPDTQVRAVRGAGHSGPGTPSFHFLLLCCFVVRRVPGPGLWELG